MSVRFYELHDSDDFDKSNIVAALGKKKPSRMTLTRKFGPGLVLAYREFKKNDMGDEVWSHPVKIGVLG